jgi:tRNA pseudouridine38-40 synthase
LRYFIQLSYLGTKYHGWQSQPNAVGVQSVLEEKLHLLLGDKVEIVASGRTDTGVHAASQIVHLDTDINLDAQFIFRMNCMLPHDIAIQRIDLVKPDAHARFDAIFREYEYTINRTKNPFNQGQAWQFGRSLDIELMNKAADMLLSHEDFQCFSKVHTDVLTFNCDIMLAKWEILGDGRFVFKIRANRFLRGMVRAIVGTLVDIGQGKKNLEDFQQVLLSKDRCAAGAAAPPLGLSLVKIGFPKDIYLEQTERSSV